MLSAAEELHYIGHTEPALITAGAALAGVLRLRAGRVAGRTASGEALLEVLLAQGVLDPADHELLSRVLRAHYRLARGYVPDGDAALTPDETADALAVIVRVVEPADVGSINPR